MPQPATPATGIPGALARALVRLGLVPNGREHALSGEPLAGGVSSDIWRVELPDGPVCVKAALPQLRVEGDWQVPVTRNRSERDWLQLAAGIVPQHVPRVIAGDGEVLVLEW